MSCLAIEESYAIILSPDWDTKKHRIIHCLTVGQPRLNSRSCLYVGQLVLL